MGDSTTEYSGVFVLVHIVPLFDRVESFLEYHGLRSSCMHPKKQFRRKILSYLSEGVIHTFARTLEFADLLIARYSLYILIKIWTILTLESTNRLQSSNWNYDPLCPQERLLSSGVGFLLSCFVRMTREKYITLLASVSFLAIISSVPRQQVV